jgi:Sortase domain
MTRDGRRVAGWAALVAGLAALAAGLALLVLPGRVPANAGSLPAVKSPAPSVRGAERATPVQSPSVTGWATPTRLVIPRLHLSAPIDPVAVRADRGLDVPDDAARLGWWVGSALPGSARGAVLVAGHVDTLRNGPGALYRLESLPLGSRIDVAAGGRTVSYRTVARRSYVKSGLPAALFRPDTAPHLALVTCGGAFRNGRYADNVVIYAEPVR